LRSERGSWRRFPYQRNSSSSPSLIPNRATGQTVP
jgi:hypothetical protein